MSPPEILRQPLRPDDPDWEPARDRVARALARGEIVGFPTETVYGVGARADDPAAVARLRAWKGRDESQPFQWLVASPEDAARRCRMGPVGLRLARHFWPGPLTLILPRADAPGAGNIPGDNVGIAKGEMDTTGDDDGKDGRGRAGVADVGLRCPDAPFLRAVIAALGAPVAASSANRAGRPPAADARAFAVGGEGEGVALLLDGNVLDADNRGAVEDGGGGVERAGSAGRPSTVARLFEDENGFRVEILRAGAISREALEAAARIDSIMDGD